MNMTKITFVTTNKGKIESMRKRLPSNIELESIGLELPELQADSGSEVVLWKAKEAYKILKRPLLVQDSSFHIDSLNGFPGAYIKYMLKTVKIEGIISIMRDVKNRSCHFEDAIGYTENGEEVKIFVSQNKGTLAKSIDEANKEASWGDLWKIFIPAGCVKTLASVTEEELDEAKKAVGHSESCFTQFVNYLNSNS